ncbi:hypothetical protein FXN63_25895 [Pigmentiphaga aceris]|uniref:Uncharacterized protein n=1 Tax=Pigmentiphaga aceris TaxID=1940612 RepID=A0A5C0B3N0_9BURK|nr:putative molybdenum carrier protein [Pigmentiphaga aceris]QEI08905.1 hypothetical protein FXN63_25895 [Pigmentiphaga aceris]
MYFVEKIVSGGQTGSDRAALDWAIVHKVPHGDGYVAQKPGYLSQVF